jgi:outer membrane protein OmpA-like peptidoglycan-associated protein
MSLRFIRLVGCLAFAVLALGLAEAADCNKAKEIYARGVQIISFEERAKTFQQAVDLCPIFPEAHVNLADAFENLASLTTNNVIEFNQLLDRAAAEYRESIKHNPNLVAPYLGLGDTYRVMGLYDKSEIAYKKASEIKPHDPRAAAGLWKINLIKSQDQGGFKSSQQILKHLKTSSRSAPGGQGPLMGFENHTVVKDRLRFDNILFNEWSTELKRGEAIQQLEEIGKAVSSADLSNYGFIVEGYTDNRGDRDRNVQLSWDRAESVKTYLIAKYGIDPSRIKTMGFGPARPKFTNDTDEHRLKNRRVELVFVDHFINKASQ